MERLEKSASEGNLLTSPLGSQESLTDLKLTAKEARKFISTVEPDKSLTEFSNMSPASTRASLSHSESSLESISAIGIDGISEKENTKANVSVNLDDQLLKEDMDDDQHSDDMEEGGTNISLSNHSQLLSPAKTGCDSSLNLLHLGRETLYRGQAAVASSSTSRESVIDVESSFMETEKITELKTKLALKDSMIEQMESRMRKFAGNVHLLLRLVCPESYDGQVDTLEETVEHMLKEFIPPDDKNDVKTIINLKPATKATTKDSAENKCSVS